MGRVKTCPHCGSLEVFSRGDELLCGKCRRRFRIPSRIDESYAKVPLSIFLSYGHEDEEFHTSPAVRLTID